MSPSQLRYSFQSWKTGVGAFEKLLLSDHFHKELRSGGGSGAAHDNKREIRHASERARELSRVDGRMEEWMADTVYAASVGTVDGGASDIELEFPLWERGRRGE